MVYIKVTARFQMICKSQMYKVLTMMFYSIKSGKLTFEKLHGSLGFNVRKVAILGKLSANYSYIHSSDVNERSLVSRK